MCDFEKSSRNAFRSVYPNINLVGCWFHYTKAIYDKVQKIGLCKLSKLNKTLKKWVHHLMSLPFLPEEDIRPTYLASHMPLVGLTPAELELVSSLKKYFAKTWLDGNESLSVFYYNFSTNNGAESYHKSVKSKIKSNHPNIWKFVTNLDKVMSDYDLEFRRLIDGLETTRNPNPKSRLNAELRSEYKTKYLNGTYTAIEYLNFISLTIGGENKSVKLLSTTKELHSITGESEIFLTHQLLF